VISSCLQGQPNETVVELQLRSCTGNLSCSNTLQIFTDLLLCCGPYAELDSAGWDGITLHKQQNEVRRRSQEDMFQQSLQA